MKKGRQEGREGGKGSTNSFSTEDLIGVRLTTFVVFALVRRRSGPRSASVPRSCSSARRSRGLGGGAGVGCGSIRVTGSRSDASTIDILAGVDGGRLDTSALVVVVPSSSPLGGWMERRTSAVRKRTERGTRRGGRERETELTRIKAVCNSSPTFS